MRIVLPSYRILTPENRFKEDLAIIEEVGRSCYMSQKYITEDGESAKKFTRNRIKEGHSAIIEFGDVIVQFCVDRGITHELVRHRLCSFAQESTRYVNYANGNRGREITVVLPSKFIDTTKTTITTEYSKEEHLTIVKHLSTKDKHIKKDYKKWKKDCEKAEKKYIDMIDNGWKPQDARSVLPTSTKAIINVKTNYTEWRHIFMLRADEVHAHPDMAYIMNKLLDEFKEKIPVLFDDIEPLRKAKINNALSTVDYSIENICTREEVDDKEKINGINLV